MFVVILQPQETPFMSSTQGFPLRTVTQLKSTVASVFFWMCAAEQSFGLQQPPALNNGHTEWARAVQ